MPNLGDDRLRPCHGGRSRPLKHPARPAEHVPHARFNDLQRFSSDLRSLTMTRSYLILSLASTLPLVAACGGDDATGTQTTTGGANSGGGAGMGQATGTGGGQSGGSGVGGGNSNAGGMNAGGDIGAGGAVIIGDAATGGDVATPPAGTCSDKGPDPTPKAPFAKAHAARREVPVQHALDGHVCGQYGERALHLDDLADRSRQGRRSRFRRRSA